MAATMTGPRPLTERQAEVFEFLWEYTCRHGFQPAMGDMAERFGFAVRQGAVNHMVALEKKGWISRTGNNRAVVFRYTPGGRPFNGLVARED